MLIDSADLIRKLPMMIQGNKTFAKFSEGGNYHIGEVDSWCLNYKEIVEGIESYCEYKRTNRYKLGAPVNGSFALNSYDYDSKTEPTGYNLLPVDKDINVRSNSSEKPNNCDTCKWGEWYRQGYDITMMSDECGGCCSWNNKWKAKTEPQTETEIAKVIVHKMIDDAVIAEDAYPDLRQKMHDVVDEYEPQTDCAWR